MQPAQKKSSLVKIPLFWKIASIILLINFPLVSALFLKVDFQSLIWITFTASLVGIVLIFILLKPLGELFSFLEKQKPLDTLSIKTKDEIEGIFELIKGLNLNLLSSQTRATQDENLLRAEADRLKMILFGVSDGIIAVDNKSQVVTFNKAVEYFTGYSQEQASGLPLGDILKLFEGTRELKVEEFSPISLEGKEGIVLTKESLRLKGLNQELFVNLLVSHIKEAKELNIGAILTLHDITKEKQLAAMQLDFVSLAAHELRTPLTSIKGYLSVLTNEKKDSLDPDSLLFLDRINISASQLMALVENLLSVSRIERGAFTVNLEPLDWTSYVRQSISDQTTRAKDKHLSLEFVEPSEAIPQASADKLRIGEVLNNLLSNAINYTPPGGEIKVTIEKKGEEIITHVIDNGPGIPPEAQAHLFTKFFRVPGKVAAGAKGTGLGLYISKAIIDLHHGKIWVESQVAKGTNFSFSLPIAQEIHELPSITGKETQTAAFNNP